MVLIFLICGWASPDLEPTSPALAPIQVSEPALRTRIEETRLGRTSDPEVIAGFILIVEKGISTAEKELARRRKGEPWKDRRTTAMIEEDLRIGRKRRDEALRVGSEQELLRRRYKYALEHGCLVR